MHYVLHLGIQTK